jgi:hypothetical protein
MISKLKTSYFAHPQGSVFSAFRLSRFNGHEISIFGSENNATFPCVTQTVIYLCGRLAIRVKIYHYCNSIVIVIITVIVIIINSMKENLFEE